MSPYWIRLLLFLFAFMGIDAEMKSELDSLLYDPCTFPDFSNELRCGIYDSLIQKHTFVCDPFGTMSMSELRLLGSTLGAIRSTKQSHCTCATGSCYYKYGFAFLNRLEPLPNRTVDNFDAEYCPYASRQMQSTKGLSSDEIYSFAHNYARLIRERNFNIGVCGEEVLILVIKEAPTGLFWQSSTADQNTDYYYKPRIFVSYGQLVMERFGVNDLFNGASFLIEPLQEIVNEENSRLQNGFPIVQVLSSFVTRIDDMLRQASNSQQIPQLKHHVPDWAWMIFGVCGVLFVLMGIGLYLIRSQTRRSSTFRGKSNTDQRKWKAGFVGDEVQQPLYANLLSQMMKQQQVV